MKLFYVILSLQMTKAKQNRKHILIVDDSTDNQLLLKMLLEGRGYTTECTSNGEEALMLLNASAELPQAILLDLRMPVMDGMTFRGIQKKNARLKDIPVVIMSGNDDMDSVGKIANTPIMQKPLELSNVLEIVRQSVKVH